MRKVVFMDWKTQYYKGVNSPQTDIQIQWNPIKPSRFFLAGVEGEIEKLILNIMSKCKGLKISPNNPEEKQI